MWEEKIPSGAKALLAFVDVDVRAEARTLRLWFPPVGGPDPGFVRVEVPPGEDDGSDEYEAEGLVAAEGAEVCGSARLGFGWVELGLGAEGHGV